MTFYSVVFLESVISIILSVPVTLWHFPPLVPTSRILLIPLSAA